MQVFITLNKGYTVKQSTHTAINWLDRKDIVKLLEGNGMACYDSESTDDLRDTLRQCVEDGDISPAMLA